MCIFVVKQIFQCHEYVSVVSVQEFVAWKGLVILPRI